MRELFERLLSFLFPPKMGTIGKWEFTAEVPNHSWLDPFRTMGRWDSWAGHMKP